MNYYIALLILPSFLEEGQVRFFADAFSDEAHATTVFKKQEKSDEDWYVQWVLDFEPSVADAMGRFFLVQNQMFPNQTILDSQKFSVEPMPEDVDWLAQSYKEFKPFTIDDFFIYGSHYDGDIPEGFDGLQIDAARAFGSGEHETTAGCIEAINNLKAGGFKPKQVLDMGTGSGILGIVAAKIWGAPVLAVDNDADAVDVAKHHVQINGISTEGTGMKCVCGDGFQTPAVNYDKPYDLILANILAGPLKEMASDMIAVTAKGGYIILSGMLNTQADEVLSVYQDHDATLIKDIRKKDWATLLLQKQ